ncbi:MAG: hypothetical protein JW702_00700 [Clostridiales bacterium]|nr:hypothetical protein [Clostridiales bacterium]
MTQEKFKSTLMQTLQNNYDIEEPYSIKNFDFEFYGQFFQRNAKYLASKKLEYYSYATYDHLFYKSVEEVSTDLLKDLYSLTEEIVDFYSKVDDEHMETSITFILHTDHPVSQEVEKYVKKKMNYIKSFSFGLNGWTKLKIIILVPTSNEVVTNKFGNRDKDVFKKIITKYHNS